MLGGGIVTYYNDGEYDGNIVLDSGKRYSADGNNTEWSGTAEGTVNLHAVVAEKNAEKARSAANVIITGNSAVLGAGIANNGHIEFGTDTSLPNETNLTVTKSWAVPEGTKLPESITVYLVINGEKSDQSVTLNTENNWTDTFSNLVKYDENEDDIQYTVVEEVPNDFVAKYGETIEDDDGNLSIRISNSIKETPKDETPKESSNKAKGQKTGLENNHSLYLGICGITFISLLILFVMKKKQTI